MQDIGVAFSVLSFREATNSGVTSGQVFDVHLIGQKVERAKWKEFLLPDGRRPEPELQDALINQCSPPPPASVPALAIPFIKQAGEFVYKFVFDQIAGRAKQLSERSQAKYQKTLLIDSEQVWTNVTCLLLVRGTDRNSPPDGSPDETGLVVLIKKENILSPKGEINSFILIPRYVRMDNAVALTGAGSDTDPATIKLDIALALRWVAVNKEQQPEIRDAATISLPSMTVPIGKTLPTCKIKDRSSLNACKYESGLIPNIRRGAAPVSVGVAVVETGSAADAEKKAKAGLEAISALVKPKYDEALAAFIARISH